MQLWQYHCTAAVRGHVCSDLMHCYVAAVRTQHVIDTRTLIKAPCTYFIIALFSLKAKSDSS
jgi:hypothetical protein